METVLGIGLANAAVAALIALLLAAAAMIFRKPALTHALAVLVLVKLLTPPIFGVPITQWFSLSTADQSKTIHADSIKPLQIKPPAPGFELPDPHTQLSVSEPLETPSEILGSPDEYITLPLQPRRGEPLLVEASPNWFTPWLLQSLPISAAVIWLYGSIVCAALIIFRIIRFQRLLRFATLAPPALQSRAEALAQRMGVDRTPQVWFVPGAVCPMLWAVGRASRLLIPNELWDRLGERQRSSLLAHELAHLRRRDHWVRLIELLASVLYWWCPVTWYARRCLREAEEQCCDAWVVWAIPGSGRDYASALLEAVEFVTLGGIETHPMPALASGMGQFHQLKRRLVMIKNERVSKSLSRSGWAAVCALALGLLPLTPTLAQFAPATAEPTAPTAPLPPVDPAIPAPTTLEVAPVPAAEPATPATTSFNLVATVRPPTVGAPAVIETLKVRPDASISLEKPITPDGRTNFEVNPKLEDERAALRAQIKDLSKQLERAQRHLANLEATAANEKWKNYPKANKPETAPTPGGATALPSIKTKSTDKRNDYEGISRADESLRSRLDRTSAGDPRSRERRLADLETNLKILLEEVHSLKNEAQITPKRPGGGESSSYDRKDAGN